MRSRSNHHGKRIGLRDKAATIAGAAIAIGAAAFLVIPALFIVVQSFSAASHFSFPPSEWGLRQYSTFFQTEKWLSALGTSLQLAAVTAGISALIVIPAVFAIYRSRLPGRGVVQVGGISGLIIPLSAYAIALYGLLTQLGLLGSFAGLVLANVTIAMPAMLIVSSSAMSSLGTELELASMISGAPKWRAMVGITGRLMVPAFLAGAVLAFVQSFDESVFVIFVGGPGIETLPKAIFESARTGIDPVITAAATLLMFATTLVMLVAVRLTRKDSVR